VIARREANDDTKILSNSSKSRGVTLRRRASISQSSIVRLRLLGGVALSILGTVHGAQAQPATDQGGAGAGAQQQAPTPPATPAPPAPATEAAPAASPAGNETALPPITVTAARHKQKPKPKPNAQAAQSPAAQPNAPTAAQAALNAKMQAFDQARDNLLPKFGAASDTLTRAAIEALPQGDNTPIDKVILQFPGVSYDSAVSNPNFHVRNEYANVQYRINGVIVPEGVSSLGPVFDTNFIGSMTLLTGTLPAQYGLRTAGVLDITSRSFATPGGEASIYGGSHNTFTPSIDYGGSFGNSEYFVTARGNWNALGLENPTANPEAIHDQTQQGKFFGYFSTLLDESTRFSVISAVSQSNFQIPNNPNLTPLGDFPGNVTSTSLNENEFDTYLVNIAALQKKGTDGDAQFAVFSRYAKINFVPDITGDLEFNNVASNVTRESLLNGTQFDTSYLVNDQHTLRGGFAVTEEKTNVDNVSTVLPVDPVTGAISPTPFAIADDNTKVGWNIGTYVQDEWKLTKDLTLNAGLRFDQLYQFVDANQLSPRVALIYKPLAGTTIHIGYARYFTPPYQAQAVTSNIALFTNTTNQPEVPLADPVKPERSNYYDVGFDQVVLPGLTVGGDVYYKDARDAIDDGQFGQAVVLTQFNYAREYSEGFEVKAKYQTGDFKAYANFSYNITRAIDIESNQYLIDAATFNFLLTNYHFTDDMQLMSGSAGASYRWNGTLFATSLLYGSGLRTGFANEDSEPPYIVVNAGVSREFQWAPDAKPLTVRFDVVNLFDKIYELRDGTGIGVFAPQFGARRGFYAGISQKL
jgi:outer membrane receptor protein involved in Fe transport